MYIFLCTRYYKRSAKLFFSLLLLIAIMAGLFYFDKASKRRFFLHFNGL